MAIRLPYDRCDDSFAAIDGDHMQASLQYTFISTGDLYRMQLFCIMNSIFHPCPSIFLSLNFMLLQKHVTHLQENKKSFQAEPN